jgi:hypothetical protein
MTEIEKLEVQKGSTSLLLRGIGSRPENTKILIMWSFLIGVMILGGYGVYYRVLGIGVPQHNSPVEAALASMLFVFGIYILALVLHGFFFGRK